MISKEFKNLKVNHPVDEKQATDINIVSNADEADDDKQALLINNSINSNNCPVIVTAGKNNNPPVTLEQPALQKLSDGFRKLSDHFEEDSGTCVDHSNSSAEMLDNVDKVQLTVSSVNSILPDLPEIDDDQEISAVNHPEPVSDENKPLLRQDFNHFFGSISNVYCLIRLMQRNIS